MKMTNTAILVVVILLSALSSSNAWAERVLINDADQTVTLNRPLDCYRSAEITIKTSRPEIYEPQSRQLQAIGDAVQTILSYECPGLSEIIISGSIRGLQGFVYQGRLSAYDRWLVQAQAPATQSSLIGGENITAVQQAHWQTARRIPRSNKGPLSITNLRLGMGIKEVSQIASGTFDTKTEYDANKGMMTMLAGGCPQDFDGQHNANAAQTDWKCLKAWFSDEPTPRLLRLELIQVVNADAERVQQLLVKKYGRPQESETSQFDNLTHLIWHVDNKHTITSQPIESLSAVLSETNKDLVVTSLTLYNQDSEAGMLSLADAGLKL